MNEKEYSPTGQSEEQQTRFNKMKKKQLK